MRWAVWVVLIMGLWVSAEEMEISAFLWTPDECYQVHVGDPGALVRQGWTQAGEYRMRDPQGQVWEQSQLSVGAEPVMVVKRPILWRTPPPEPIPRLPKSRLQQVVILPFAGGYYYEVDLPQAVVWQEIKRSLDAEGWMVYLMMFQILMAQRGPDFLMIYVMDENPVNLMILDIDTLEMELMEEELLGIPPIW